MSGPYPYIIQGKNIVIVVNNVPHTISKTHLMYKRVLDAIKAQAWDVIDEIIDPKPFAINYGKGNITIEGDRFFWCGVEMHNALTRRFIEMIQQDFPVEPLVAFVDNMMENPSKRAVEELYTFLERCKCPITPDGSFLAYKKVRADYMDCHSGTVINKPAYLIEPEDLQKQYGSSNEVSVAVENDVTVISMQRNFVDDNAHNVCSTGLHFCSIDYLSSFSGERTMIVKINPRDVVSIPVDYSHSKGRTCRYEVVGELGVSPEEAFTAAVQENANVAATEE
jgi:hypothetical protein